MRLAWKIVLADGLGYVEHLPCGWRMGFHPDYAPEEDELMKIAKSQHTAAAITEACGCQKKK